MSIEEFHPIVFTLDTPLNEGNFAESMEVMATWASRMGLNGFYLSSLKVESDKIICKVFRQSDLDNLLKPRQGEMLC